MSMSIDGNTVMNVCCHSNGYSSAAIVFMHVLSMLDKALSLSCTTVNDLAPTILANINKHCNLSATYQEETMKQSNWLSTKTRCTLNVKKYCYSTTKYHIILPGDTDMYK